MQPFGSYLTHESRVIVLGLPRYGKTRLVRDVLTADAERVLYHDVTGHDYWAPGRLPLSIDELEVNPHLLNSQYMRLVVIAADPGNPDSLLDEVRRIKALVYPTPGNMVVCFDEVGSHHRKTEKELNNFFARGSHYRIATILAAQLATDLPLNARKNCSDCYAFGQHHPTELKAIYDCYGDIYAAEVSKLRKGANPLHWLESEREVWWSNGARSKFLPRGNNAALAVAE